VTGVQTCALQIFYRESLPDIEQPKSITAAVNYADKQTGKSYIFTFTKNGDLQEVNKK